jgi:hypothetical protein
MKSTGDSTKLEGTNNYAQNKTPKNLQIIAKLEGRVGRDNKYPETKGKKKLRTKQNFQKSQKKRRVGGARWRGQ